MIQWTKRPPFEDPWIHGFFWSIFYHSPAAARRKGTSWNAIRNYRVPYDLSPFRNRERSLPRSPKEKFLNPPPLDDSFGKFGSLVMLAARRYAFVSSSFSSLLLSFETVHETHFFGGKGLPLDSHSVAFVSCVKWHDFLPSHNHNSTRGVINDGWLSHVCSKRVSA